MVPWHNNIYDIFKTLEIENLISNFVNISKELEKVTNIAIISELGNYPLYFSLLQSILLCWHILEICEDSSLLHNAYNETINLSRSNFNCLYKSVFYFSKKINISLSECKEYNTIGLNNQKLLKLLDSTT